MTKYGWLNFLLAILSSAIGMILVIMGLYWLLRQQPNDPAISLKDLLPAASTRDPFSCGQGLRQLLSDRVNPLRKTFVNFCCNPPVEDIAGLVAPACQQLEVHK